MSNQFKNEETITSVEEAINNILKDTRFNACVIKTLELYKANMHDPEDMRFQHAPMYEASIEDELGEPVSETTGRYCNLSSVKDELEAFAYELVEKHLLKQESFCPMCCDRVTYNPENSECDECGAVIPDGVIELEEQAEEAQRFRATLKATGYTQKEIENIAESTPVLYIQPENDHKPTDPTVSDSVRYFAVGQVRDGLFTGLVHGYEGGGEYSDHPVLDGKFMPYLGLGDIPIEDGDIEDALNIHTDRIFLERCQNKLAEYIKYDHERFCYVIKNRQKFDSTSFDTFNKPDYANTEFGNPLETWTNEEYLEQKHDIYSLAKERIVFHYAENSNYDNETLIKIMRKELGWDLACSPFTTKVVLDKVERYIVSILNHAENYNLTLKDYNLMDCDICSNCNRVSLPDDELYESYEGNYLCASCSIRCDGCEEYFTEKETCIIDGFFVCNKCVKKGE